MNKTFIIQSQIEEVERLPEIIAEICQPFPNCSRIEMQLQLILEELITNIIVHGYQGKPKHTIELNYCCNTDLKQIHLQIRDQAPAFNPFEELPAVDLLSGIEEKAIGGLGIHLINQLVDERHYDYQSPYNIITLVKNIP